MIRHLKLFILSCLCMASMPCLADNQEIEITLNADNEFTQTADLNCGIITVSATPSSNRETARVTIGLENTTTNFGLLLFNMNYNDKQRKKLKNEAFYEIVTDNESLKYGTEYVNNLSRNVFIDTRDATTIPLNGLASVPSLEPKVVTIPIYTCIIEKRDKNTSEPKKLKLIDLNTFELKITVELGPDEEFEELVQECNDLIAEIDSAVFCTNAKHKPSLESQKKKYADKVKEQKNKVRRFANDHGVSSRNLSEKYTDLIESLDKAYDDKVESADDCGKHSVIVDPPQTTRRCSKCKRDLPLSAFKGKSKTCKDCQKSVGPGPVPKPTSASTVLANLQRIYKELDNGKYKGNKKAALAEAQKWYNEATKLPGSKTKDAAIREYNKIQNY